jgi:hypothetical protein
MAYTAAQLAEALHIDSTPSYEPYSPIQNWAEDVIAWGDDNLTEYEWQMIERQVFGDTLTEAYN